MVEPQEPNIGPMIRRLRDAKNLSLRELAQASGLSVNAISRIERGENSPTVASLHLIATALDVRISDLFEAAHDSRVVFVKANQHRRSQADGITLETLATGLHNQQIEPFLITLAPSAGSLDNPITHPGQEFVLCLSGQVDYHVGERVFSLEAGDSLLFEASERHCFQNTGETEACILVVFQAAIGIHLARKRHFGS